MAEQDSQEGGSCKCMFYWQSLLLFLGWGVDSFDGVLIQSVQYAVPAGDFKSTDNTVSHVYGLQTRSDWILGKMSLRSSRESGVPPREIRAK